jgi:hypothetical protein
LTKNVVSYHSSVVKVLANGAGFRLPQTVIISLTDENTDASYHIGSSDCKTRSACVSDVRRFTQLSSICRWDEILCECTGE